MRRVSCKQDMLCSNTDESIQCASFPVEDLKINLYFTILSSNKVGNPDTEVLLYTLHMNISSDNLEVLQCNLARQRNVGKSQDVTYFKLFCPGSTSFVLMNTYDDFNSPKLTKRSSWPTKHKNRQIGREKLIS